LAAFQGIYSAYEKYDALFDIECMDWSFCGFSTEKQVENGAGRWKPVPSAFPPAPPMQSFIIFEPLIKSVKCLLHTT